MDATRIDPTQQWVDSPPEFPPEDEEVMAGIAQAMPWVLSLMFHVGLFLIMVFVVFLTRHIPEVLEVKIPKALRSLDNKAVMSTPRNNPRAKKTSEMFVKKSPIIRETPDIDAGKSPEPLKNISGLGASGNPMGGGPFDMGGDDGIGGPPYSRFFPNPDRPKDASAWSVVYVIDRSGSMMDTLDAVRLEMIRSIVRLSKRQDFHVIFFNSGARPQELDSRRLVPAERSAKRESVRFLNTITSGGQTDPVPALKRAFAVLRRAKRKGKIIYLLTDGVFPDNEAVLSLVRKENADRSVNIHTILYGSRPAEAEAVLKTIASRNGGNYSFQEHGE